MVNDTINDLHGCPVRQVAANLAIPSIKWEMWPISTSDMQGESQRDQHIPRLS